MSKPISFPILEIVTLLVVLVACVLIIVPGFDEYATSMLLNLNNRVSVSPVGVAQNTTNETATQSPEISPERLAAKNETVNRVDAPAPFPELKIQTNLDADTNFENDPQVELGMPPGDELLVEHQGDNAIQPDLDSNFDSSAPRELAANQSVSRSDDSSSIPTRNSLATELSRYNRFIERTITPDDHRNASSELPRIIHPVGSHYQQQASPARICLTQLFESDKRVVINTTLTDPPIATNPILNISSGMESRNEEPYQIRTTARPSDSDSANTNDFVPKR